MVGLAAFAMVLALVEQVVLETLEANVKRGSKVFETGHVSAKCWTTTLNRTRQVFLCAGNTSICLFMFSHMQVWNTQCHASQGTSM
jgi:hypothetical protein